MEFFVISLFPTSCIAGINYYPSNEEYDYNEMNIYLFVIQLKFKFYAKKEV
jgi:hypothetical protein